MVVDVRWDNQNEFYPARVICFLVAPDANILKFESPASRLFNREFDSELDFRIAAVLEGVKQAVPRRPVTDYERNSGHYDTPLHFADQVSAKDRRPILTGSTTMHEAMELM